MPIPLGRTAPLARIRPSRDARGRPTEPIGPNGNTGAATRGEGRVRGARREGAPG